MQRNSMDVKKAERPKLKKPLRRPTTNVVSNTPTRMDSAPIEVSIAPLDTRKIRQDLRDLHQVIKAVRNGDFTVRMKLDEDGLVSEIGEVLNDIIERLETGVELSVAMRAHPKIFNNLLTTSYVFIMRFNLNLRYSL